jgi:hypothetical protein
MQKYKISETDDGTSIKSLDHDHVCRVANAMRDYRREHINEPLSRLWARLALVALQTD